MRDAPERFPPRAKLGLAFRIWWRFLRSVVAVRQHALPVVIDDLGRTATRTRVRTDPRRLGRIVFRLLRLGPWRARCLFTSLVLYRLLREQGDRSELVIGLPIEPRDKDAHAWVELDGVDVGPPPGGGRHQEFARFG